MASGPVIGAAGASHAPTYLTGLLFDSNLTGLYPTLIFIVILEVPLFRMFLDAILVPLALLILCPPAMYHIAPRLSLYSLAFLLLLGTQLQFLVQPRPTGLARTG